MSNSSFDGLLAFWNSKTAAERQELVKDLNAFHSLRTRLHNSGVIECNKLLTEIIIKKDHPGVEELKKILKKTGAQGITIKDERDKSRN